MASDAEGKDIKAIIRAFFQPGEAGLLTNGFLSVGASAPTVPLKGNDKLERFQLGQLFVDGDSESNAPGFILGNGQQKARAARLQEIERQKNDDATKLAIDIFKATLAQRLANLEAELLAIDARLEVIRQRRNEIGDGMSALQDIDEAIANGTFDPDNEAHAALMRKAGINPDDMRDKDRRAEILARRRGELSNEDAILADEWNRKMKRRGVIIAEKNEVEGALTEISSADTDEALLMAERRAETVIGQLQVAEAATRTTDTAAKIIAAEAVGLSAESEASNKAVALDAKSFVASSDELDWDAPSAAPAMPKP